MAKDKVKAHWQITKVREYKRRCKILARENCINIASCSISKASTIGFSVFIPIFVVVIFFLNCQVLVKNSIFVAGMTRRFVSAKRLIRYFSNSSKRVEHRAQSPVREVKMLAVWPSIAEGFPTASSRVYMQ